MLKEEQEKVQKRIKKLESRLAALRRLRDLKQSILIEWKTSEKRNLFDILLDLDQSDQDLLQPNLALITVGSLEKDLADLREKYLDTNDELIRLRRLLIYDVKSLGTSELNIYCDSKPAIKRPHSKTNYGHGIRAVKLG